MKNILSDPTTFDRWLCAQPLTGDAHVVLAYLHRSMTEDTDGVLSTIVAPDVIADIASATRLTKTAITVALRDARQAGVITSISTPAGRAIAITGGAR